MKHMKYTLSLAAILTLFCLSSLVALEHPFPARAGTVLFQEDFSQGLGKWQAIRGAQSNFWNIVNGQVRGFVNQPGQFGEIVPQDQYWNPNWKNYEYEMDYTPLLGTDRNLSFEVKDINNWYEIHFVDTFFNFVHIKDGQLTLNEFQPFFLQNGLKYHVMIRFNEGHIQIFFNNTKIVDEQDASYDGTGGKISLRIGTGTPTNTSADFDNIIVSALDDPTPSPTPSPSPIPAADGSIQLGAPLYKQSDTRWKDQIYDAALNWAAPDKPTIQRWGCAMTSVAMILQYHGINITPEGFPLDPGTLNTWLQSQKDGYFADGALNWVAVTRLTRLINEQLGTPKLEYSRLAGSIENAKAEIYKDKPVILEIDGHFLVGDGVTAGGNDLYIKDPAYRFTQFSQHKTNLLSVRKFQPSFTDLSYIVIPHDPALHITIKDTNGQSIPNIDQEYEKITDPEIDGNGQSNPPLMVEYFPKPSTQKYTVEMTADKPQNYTLDIWSYDKAANASLFEQKGVAGPQPSQFILDFQKENHSAVLPKVNFTQVRQDLKNLQATKQIFYTFAYKFLDQFASYGEVAAATNKLRYAQQMVYYLNQYKPYMAKEALTFLQTELSNIMKN